MRRDRLPGHHRIKICHAQALLKERVEYSRCGWIKAGVPQALSEIEIVAREPGPSSRQPGGFLGR
jgi:hypothetical protein